MFFIVWHLHQLCAEPCTVAHCEHQHWYWCVCDRGGGICSVCADTSESLWISRFESSSTTLLYMQHMCRQSETGNHPPNFSFWGILFYWYYQWEELTTNASTSKCLLGLKTACISVFNARHCPHNFRWYWNVWSISARPRPSDTVSLSVSSAEHKQGLREQLGRSYANHTAMTELSGL